MGSFEAMISGRPVVASDMRGARDVISHAAAGARCLDFGLIAQRYLALYQKVLDSVGKRPREAARP